MITIKFNNGLYIYLTTIQLDKILESLQSQGINLPDYLDGYSFSSPDALYDLIQDKGNLVIYYHQTVPEDFNILNPQDFETVLKGLEQLYIYQRDFPLLQMDFFPGALTIIPTLKSGKRTSKNSKKLQTKNTIGTISQISLKSQIRICT